MTTHDFFKGFVDAAAFDGALYRLKDVDASAASQMSSNDASARVDRLPRHHRRLISRGLPFQEYTNPEDGPMNATTHLPRRTVGGAALKVSVDAASRPRHHVAYGRVEENGLGDCVTRLTAGSGADVVDVMTYACDATTKSRVGQGAEWHVFRRRDAAAVESFLKRRRKHLTHRPKDGAKVHHPLHDGVFFLTANDLELLRAESKGAIAPWTFTQRERDAALIPAGCPRQIRNLSSTLRVAIEFASPESAAAALRASDERRALPENHVARRSEEKTHPRVALLHAANDAVRYLDRAAAE
mgnify:CR=1 FL=1